VSGLRVTFGKELLSHFYSPVSYLIAVLYYLLHGAIVSGGAQAFAQQHFDREMFPTWSYSQGSTGFMVLWVPGLLTMRCIAEERRTGSIETLMTAPVSDLGVVLGKWLASVAFFLLLWLPTVVLLWVLTWSPFLDTHFAPGPVFAAYLGMFLLSAFLLAFGCFASSLTDNLLLAAIVPILFDFSLVYLPDKLRHYVGDPKESPLLAHLVEQLDVAGNFQQWFARGLIDTGQLWFYVGGALFFLFLTVQTFSARRVGGFRLRTLGSWLNLAASTVLMLGVWVLLIWVGGRPALRTLIDMTPGARASVDPVTAELLHDLTAQDVKVEFHAFLMAYGAAPEDPRERQRLANLQRLQELTRVLLKQYDYLGGDATTVYVYDGSTDPDVEREARQRLGTSDTECVVLAVKQPGKAPRTRKLSLEGDFAVIDIPELRPGNNNGLPTVPLPILKDFRGEQALSSALKGLLVEGTPVVYVLRGTERDGLEFLSPTPLGYAAWVRALTSSGFDVRQLSLAQNHGGVPRDAAMVAVLEPRSPFTNTDADALYNYVKRGGRLFLDYSWSPIPDWNPDGEELGHRLGFEVGRQPVFHRVYDGSPEGLDGIRHVSKLQLFVNANHDITRRIWSARQNVQFDIARPLTVRTDAPPGLRIEPLLTTGPLGWLGVRRDDGELDFKAPSVPGAMGEFTVGLAIEVDGDKPQNGDKPPTGRVVVTSGAFCNNAGMGINGDLALNICNWLAERRLLLDIRGSGYKADYFTLDERRRGNVARLLGGVPLVFLLSGLAMFFLRRRL
jgi:ABC-2 type transport system permease protein